MKFIRETSDIHLDWDMDKMHQTRLVDRQAHGIREAMDFLWYPPPLADDLDTTFVIAGDIWLDGNFANKKNLDGDTWIMKISRQFKYVVLVLGNHDYWDRNILYEADKIKKSIVDQGITNTFLLERDVVVLDQVKFIGGCLWTDYHRGDPLIMFEAVKNGMMKDYKYIRSGPTYSKIRPQELAAIHHKTKEFIFANTFRDYPEQKVVVVTHMAPSFESVTGHYRQSHWLSMNFLYYSDMDNRIMQDGQNIDFWFHGHMHHTTEYHIGVPKVVLNPRGYSSENTFFNPEMQIPV
jgi:hypothetical protein